MAEISNGSVFSGKPVVAAEKEDLTFTKIDERDRDNSDQGDDIDQILIALQVLMPPMEPLALQSQISGCMEPNLVDEKGSSRSSQPHQLVAQRANKNGDISQSRHFISNKDGDSMASWLQNSAFHEHTSSRSITASFFPVKHSQVSTFRGGTVSIHHQTDDFPVQSSSHQRKYEEEIREKILDENDKKTRNELTEKSLRDRQMASSLLPLLKNKGMPASIVLPLKAVTKTVDDTGWVYNFRSWGRQHAVRILPSGVNPQFVMQHSPISLQPSSTLVEQRLHEHGRLPESDGQWRANNHNDEQRQQQHRHPQHMQDEEEA